MKKYRPILIGGLVLLVVIVGLNYIRLSLRRASMAPQPSLTPSLEDAPVRVYGTIEPLGREVFLGPLHPGRVTWIGVNEGDDVKSEQALCELESEVQEPPSQGRELRRYFLRSPIHGHLYKFDVRLGELLTPEDYPRIVLGKREKQVRLAVESFWMEKVRVGDRFVVRDAENLHTLGEGTIVSVSEYVGTRDFRTDDAQERLDTKYAQAILQLKGAANIPLGKLVLCERP